MAHHVSSCMHSTRNSHTSGSIPQKTNLISMWRPGDRSVQINMASPVVALFFFKYLIATDLRCAPQDNSRRSKSIIIRRFFFRAAQNALHPATDDDTTQTHRTKEASARINRD